MQDIQNVRWKLLECDTKNGEFIVHDALFNKKRAFHVPMLMHSIVEGHHAYVSTSRHKLMQIDLNSTKRQFISPSTLTPEQHQQLFPRDATLQNTKPQFWQFPHDPTFQESGACQKLATLPLCKFPQ